MWRCTTKKPERIVVGAGGGGVMHHSSWNLSFLSLSTPFSSLLPFLLLFLSLHVYQQEPAAKDIVTSFLCRWHTVWIRKYVKIKTAALLTHSSYTWSTTRYTTGVCSLQRKWFKYFCVLYWFLECWNHSKCHHIIHTVISSTWHRETKSWGTER